MIRLVAFFEHQTSAEPTLSLRFLGDTVRTWENQSITHSNNSPLPIILPVVLAQNSDVWHLSIQFRTLFDIPKEFTAEIQPFLPDFCFRLVKLPICLSRRSAARPLAS
jgi:Putative transposase, YhgA-like